MQQLMFDSLFLNSSTITLFDVLLNVILSCCLGLFVSWIYKLTYQGYAYSVSFVNTLLIITMVTTIVIMVIGNNLARAFGLVGAMSIIRFRTAVKDSKDIAFVFFALAAGMAAGAGNHIIGIAGCLSVGLIAFFLHITQYGSTCHEEMLLRFWSIPERSDKPIYQDLFEQYFQVYNMASIRSARLGEFLELTFNVRFKKNKQHQLLIQELTLLEGIEKVSLLYGENITEN